MQNKYEHASKRLKQKRERLISSFLKDNEPDFLRQHSRILDDYFCESFEKSMVGPSMEINKNPYAIIAVGGYGRKEQCVHSDVDLLFLFKKRIPDKTDDLIREILYPLWDIGLDIGHATRSLKESVKLAGEDLEVLTSILDARYICGISLLYSELMEQLRKKVILKQANKIIMRLIENSRNRHQHFGDSTYLLEPNLKEGQGGLRDYHTMLWIGRIKYNLKEPRGLEYFGCLSQNEFQTLTKALSFIWDVRNHLHHMTGKKCDQLYFEYQTKLAGSLKFNKKEVLQPVERFLGKLHGEMEFIKQQNLMFLYEHETAKKGFHIKRKIAKSTGINGLEVQRDMLNFTSSEEILKSPALLIKIFEESARLEVPLSIEAKRLVKEFAHMINEDFRTSASAVKSFEKILVTHAPTFNVLNEMINTGFLAKFIPEIKAIVNRIQYDEYHIYPVDKHLLRTVQTIKNFGTSEDRSNDSLCGNLYKELFNRKLLLWAAILHDIGKGKPGKSHAQKGGEIVRRLLAKKRLKQNDIDTISFLVEKHLLLIKTASRRDLNDESTAVSCAREIKDIERLKMLYVLTVADSMATGPKAWSSWTAALLRGLFLKVFRILEKGELATEEAVQLVEKKKEKVFVATSPQSKQNLKKLINFMSTRYLLYTPEKDILEHIRLYNTLEHTDFTWKVTKTPNSNTRTVAICAKDCPGLFSKIAGVFTLNSLNILDAKIYTWRNNIALDIFEVMAPADLIFEDEKWDRTKKNLIYALSGELDLAAAVNKRISDYPPVKHPVSKRPHRIVVDNKSSSFFTIIEVFTYDFPGLLFRITDVLFNSRLDIRVAKITKVDQVVDIFYVRDFEGQKVDSDAQIAKIEAAIEKVLIETDRRAA